MGMNKHCLLSLELLVSCTFIAIVFFMVGCQPKKVEFPNEIAEKLPEKIDYNLHVKPLLSDRCFACHGPDKNARKADLRLDTEEGAFMAIGDNKDRFAIEAGNPHDSEVFKRMFSDDEELVMPPPESNISLTEYEKAVITRWIEQGAEYKPHWSFIPPEKPAIPTPKAAAQAVNEIDNFILAKLENEGIAPSALAEKERLIRRVSLDLTGLPPTLEEIDAFLTDNSPSAYEKVVDRLLASESYGERMALEWMDISRYADSHGMHADGARLMWPWRDWVIQSFNNNMPYDEFITWQIAGDMMPNATTEQKLATAFNRNHAMTAEGGVVDEEFRLKYVFDRANTTATAFLGLTMECAQCHDHKFDPISQKDYYAFSAFYNNVRELGMTGDDGNFGPMLLLPSEQEKHRLDSLEEEKSALLSSIENLKKDKSDLLDFINQLPEDKIVVSPKPTSYYPIEKITETNKKKIIDSNRKTRVSNEPQLVEGIKGKALHFDDGFEFLELEEVGKLEMNEPYTAIIWVKPDVKDKIQTLLCTTGDKNTFWRGWELYLDSANHPSVKLINSLPHNLIHIKSQETIPVGEWTQLAFTYDGTADASGLKIYVNNKEVKTKNLFNKLYKTIRTVNFGNHKAVNRPIRIARSYRGHTGEFGIYNGAVDEVRVFNKTLSGAEIDQLYQTTIGNTVSPIKALPDEMQHDYYLTSHDATYQELIKNLRSIIGNSIEAIEHIPEVMVMEEMEKPRAMHVLDRGQYDAPKEKVDPATPESVLNFSHDLPKNRIGLAKWLISEGNPLTARVTVNRYWLMVFGRGIVDTPEDFGLQGSLPSHPKLLDWLAIDFRESGWDVKKLLKTMVMSATYRQSTKYRDDLQEKDPSNILLARGPSSRLPAEMIRDNALAASGLLVNQVGGASVKPYQPDGLWIEKGNFSHELLKYEADQGDSLYRRSLYTFVRRTSPHPAMVAFDAPNREICTINREKTNTPLQALVLLNDPQFVEAAKVMAVRIQEEADNTEKQLSHAFRLATGRIPGSSEVGILKELYTDALDRFKGKPKKINDLLAVGEYAIASQYQTAETAALSVISSTLLNHDEVYTKR